MDLNVDTCRATKEAGAKRVRLDPRFQNKVFLAFLHFFALLTCFGGILVNSLQVWRTADA